MKTMLATYRNERESSEAFMERAFGSGRPAADVLGIGEAQDWAGYCPLEDPRILAALGIPEDWWWSAKRGELVQDPNHFN